MCIYHQPISKAYEGATRNSEYFWYPDLEEEALAQGWKPRGKKKEEVPWERQDIRGKGALTVVKPSGVKRKSAGVKRKAVPCLKVS